MEKQGEFKIKKTNYIVYKNDDGFLELWHSVGRDKTKNKENTKTYDATDYTRIITRARTMEDLPNHIRVDEKVKEYDPYLDKNQLKIQ